MADAVLQISPVELKFRFELRKTIPVTLSLSNPGNERIAFKVKTTSPKKYCVRPSSGVVEPGSTKDVQVIMQAQREYPPSMTDVKDKFLVQYVRVGSDVKDIGTDTFDSKLVKDIKQIKLRVVLVGPPKPPSPVPEGVEEEPSPIKNTFKETSDVGRGTNPSVPPGAEDVAMLKQERNKLKDELSKVEKDKADIKKRLEMMELRNEGKQTASAQKVASRGGGFTVLHLLLVAIFAFLLGHYTSLGGTSGPPAPVFNVTGEL